MKFELFPEPISRLSKTYRINGNFPAVAALYAKKYIEYIRGNFFLNHITGTEIHHMIIAYIFYLNYFMDRSDPASGVTLTRVQEYCSRHKLAGPRKVAALLGVIRAAGYCTREVAPIDARIKVFVPTAKAIEALNGVLSPAIEAAQILDRTDQYKSFVDHYPQAICAVSSYGFRKLYISGLKIIDGIPSLRQFFEMSGGLKLLFSLYHQRNSDNVVFCRAADISKSFGVSRTQMQRIMSLARERNYVNLDDPLGRRIELLPPMLALIEAYISVHLAMVSLGARRAIACADLRTAEGSNGARL